MAIIFFGTPLFAVPCLKALLDSGEEVSLVVTQPDRVKGRGHTLAAPPVKELALARGLRVVQPKSVRTEEFLCELAAIKPEFIIVVAYGRILPEGILSLPLRGCINIHASLLPKYRGAAPIQWALLNGERVTGVTSMVMDAGLDTGDILLEEPADITDSDTSETLFHKLSCVGADLLLKTIAGLRSGLVTPRPQPEGSSQAPPLRKEDGRIDWTRDSGSLSNFVRGMHPWPGAFSYLGSERIKVLKVRSVQGRAQPGELVTSREGELVVGAGNGLLLLEEIQPEGRKAMSGKAFLAGRKAKGNDEKFS